MAYIPNPSDPTQPVDSVLASTAAAEFRALKGYIQTIVAGGGPGAIPPASIWHFALTSAPAGYLNADGSLQLRSAFPVLWAVVQAQAVSEDTWAAGSQGLFSTGDGITNFRLPDFRSEFLRGADLGRGAAGGHAVGTTQIASAVCNFTNSGFPTGYTPDTASVVLNPDDGAVQFNGGGLTFTLNAGAGVANRPYGSVRPRNAAVLICIKT